MKLPSLPEGFTVKFLGDLLQRPLRSVGIESVGEGTGMMADMSRLTLEFEDSTEPLCMIAKYSAQNPTNREVAVSFNLYEREARYYSELDHQTDICTPEIYFVDVDGSDLLILMEDLGDYAVGSQELGADLHQTEIAIDQLAKLHGAFWGKVDHLEWVPGIANSFHADNMYNFCQTGWDVMANSFDVGSQVNPFKDAFVAALPMLQAQQNRQPRTLLHGDFRMENLLYGTEARHEDVVVIDFQGPLLGSGFVDLALFLGQSTRTSIRRDHERNLVDRYMTGLERQHLSLDDVLDPWEAYRQAILYNWVYASVVAGTLDSSNEKAFAWMQQMVNRQLEVSLDLDIFSLI